MTAEGHLANAFGELRPLQVGPLTVRHPVGLSPMAGYTDAAMRALCRRFQCGFTFTEVANAQGLVHGSRPTFHLLDTVDGESPVGAHIYGSDPAAMAEAARIIEDLGQFDFIDVNAGCPVRKIVAKGAGVALMSDPALVGRIVAAMSAAVRLPITLKTRLGLTGDTVNVEEVTRAAEESGAAAVFIHARVAARKHSGPADWEALARLKSLRGIPVVGNGGVECADDAFAMIEQTGVDGVIIGRAAIGNPWLFEEIACKARGEAWNPPSAADRIRVIEEHFDTLQALKERDRRYRRQRSGGAEQATALHLRGHLVKYLRGRPHWAAVRTSLNRMTSREAVMNAVHTVLDRA